MTRRNLAPKSGNGTSRFFILVATLAAAGLVAGAATAQVETGKPIVLKQPKAKILKHKGEVVAATPLQIVVRSRENERMIRTFSLSPKLQQKMQQIIERGGYQAGDRVEIHYQDGTDVALKIKGKPSGVR